MKTTARVSIFVFLAVATTTTLTLGTSTALAASFNTHTPHINQLNSNGDDWFPTSTALAASNTHTHHHNMHLLSSNGNHLTGTNGINSIGSRNNDFPAGWTGDFGHTQYGSTVGHSYHHHIPTDTIAGINGANSGFGGNADFPTGWAFSN
jgi:hypothetical protein